MGYTEDLQAKMARLKSGEPKESKQETITKAVNQIRENTGLPIPNLVTNAINSVPKETANKLVKQNYDTRLQDKMARLKGTVQQVQQPVQNIVQEPVIPQAVTPTFVGAAALQESNIQKKASDIKAKFKQGEALTDNDMKILAQAQHDKQLEKEVDYRAGKKEAEKVPTLAPVLTENGLGNSLELLRAKNNPVTRYDKNYGIQEAKEEFKTLDFNNNKNGEKYLEYKEGLEEAQKNNDTRNIAKYSGLLQAYKDTFKAKYGNTKDNTDLVSVKNSINDLYKDRQDIISRFNKSQDQNERLRIAEEYNRVNDLIQSKTKTYSDALAYDEIVNNNIISDSAKSLWKNTLGGTANAINAAYAYGSKGLGLDATSLNADALLAYNGGENFNINDVTNILNKTNPVSMVATNATGFGQGAAGAFNNLQILAGMYPNNERLTNLYNEIKNHSYKGTSEDLKKELDTIQQELYQGFKDEFTQDEIDKVADQLRHNEIYGDLKAIPNAFGTVGNMIPSILVGTATGGLGELGGATANVAQQIGSYGTLGLGAAGSGMDKALQEGANYNQALAYGALSGATEVGTEMLGGETVNKVFGQTGKTALGKLFGKTIDNLNLETKVGKFIANQVSGVTEEMTEEMISEALDPLWQQLTYNQNALPKNLDEVGEYFKNILNAGIEAIPSTLLMQGGGMLMKARNVQTVENGMIDSINQSNLSQTTKNELINEVKKAARDVKLGIQESESDNIREQITEGMDSGVVDRAASELVNKPSEVQSIADKVKAKGLNVPESTQGLLQYVQDHRSGLNIELDDTIKGNGTHTTTNEDGTRTIRINPKSENAVEVILAHELGHDFKGTKFYSDLQDTVLKYAEGLPQFKEALEALDKTYKDGQVTYNLNDEATNDILAQALGNQEFLNTLAQAKPNLFERIYNWFKNVLFDGNNSGLNLEQRRLLNKMEQGFRNAYQAAYQGKGNETSNSLSEDEKTLAATHNLTRDKLKGILELGGFPVPSIAISDVNKLTPTQFGDITVLFDKDTINPENPANEVYDRDVWSPTFPQVDYEIDDLNVEKAAEDLGIEYWRLKDFAEEANDLDELVRRLTRNSTSDTIIDNFIKDNNLKYETKYREPDISWRNKEKSISDFVKANNISVKKLAQDDSLRQQYFEKLQQEFNKDEDEVKFIQEEIDTLKGEFQVLKDFPSENRRLLNLLQRDFDAINGEKQIDYYETNKNKLKVAEEAGLNDYLKEKLKYVYGDKWIRNDKEIFTPSGNRRSFNQLHDEYNLDNIVDAMTKQRTISSQAGLFGPFGKISANMSHRFKSIKEIRANKGSLIADENNTQLQDYKQNILDDIDELANYYRHKEGFYTGQENASESLLDLAKSGKLDVENFDKILEENVINSSKVPDELKKKIFDDLNKLKTLKTDYFEAKPQRAVGLDEISSVLIPNDLPDEQKQALADRGIRYIEYNPEVEGDREAKYREAAQNVLFSKSNGKWQNFLNENFNLQPNATRTYFPTNEELQRSENESVKNEPVTLMNTGDETLFSLSEEQQEEVQRWADDFEKDTSIDPKFAAKIWRELNQIQDYVDFEDIKREVEKYKSGQVEERKPSEYTNLRQKAVKAFINDYNTALGTIGKTMRGTDVKSVIENNIGKEPGNTRTIQRLIKSMNEDMMNGTLTDNKIQEYVDSLGKNIKSTANEYYEQYKDLKRDLRNAKMFVPDEVKNSITDYNDFRKSTMGKLSLTSDNSRRSIDQVYKELQEIYPEMFPEDIVNPADQLEYMADLSSQIVKEEGSLQDILEKQYGSEAWTETADKLKQDLIDLRDTENESNIVTEDKEQKSKNLKWTKTAQSNPLINQFIKEKEMAYIPRSNKKTLDFANKRIDNLGFEDSVKYIENKVSMNDKVDVNDIATAEVLIQEAIKKGDFETAQDLIADTAIMGKELGQAVQALSMISRLTPEGQLRYINKVVNKINDSISKKGLNKNKSVEQITLDKDLQTNILKAQNDVELQNAVDAALQRIADQMPATMSEKIAEWRYLAMLLNPRTHVRNIVANVGMKGMYGTKNILQRTIETLSSPLLEERTRTFKKASEDVKKFAKQSSKDMADALARSDSKSVDARIREMRKVFKTAPLEKLRRLNSKALSLEDNIFTQNAYKNNLQEYLTANGIKTQHDIDMNPELVNKGIQFATEEAWKTTFHQLSKAANAISKLENINGFTKVLLGGMLPFKSTPINIAKTGAAYSPLGLLETVTAETYKLKTGQITANQWIDRLSQGLTGSTLFGLGFLLSKAGILKGSTDEDEEYLESIGKTKAYSVRLGNKNYDISWFAPAAMPLLMGAELSDASNGGELSVGEIAETMASTINPLSEMSFVSGLNSTLKSYSNSDSPVDAIGAAGSNAVKSYFGQFTPTIFGQFNKVIDDTQRTTTASKNSQFRDLENFGRQQLNKIPGGSFLLEPKTDVWGNEVKRDDNVIVRALDAFVNPGTVTEDKSTPVDEELLKLFSETGEKKVTPSIPSMYFNKNNYKYEMSAKEYTQFKKTYGQEAYNGIEALIKTSEYKDADAEDKAKMVEDIFSEAQEKARTEYGFNPDDLIKKYGEKEAIDRLLNSTQRKKYDKYKTELEDENIGIKDFYNAMVAQTGVQGDKDKDGKTIYLSQDNNKKTAIDKAVGDLSQKQKETLYGIFSLSKKVY